MPTETNILIDEICKTFADASNKEITQEEFEDRVCGMKSFPLKSELRNIIASELKKIINK